MSPQSPASEAGARARWPASIAAAAQQLRAGDLKAVELTRHALQRADRLDGRLGVFVARLDESALAAAARADDDFAAGIDRGPLQGIPIALKDLIAVEGVPTTAQSLVPPRGFEAAPDAPVVARLKAAGAVIVGKTTTAEYATGVPDPSRPFPVPRNPWSPAHWTGGSSSGSAGGVAAGLFLGALGTDTGGSIRMPAAWCGISGLKPTFGRVPKAGVVPLGATWDAVGPMARSAADCAVLLQQIAGAHEADPASAATGVPDYGAALTGDVTGLRIGVDLSALQSPAADPRVGALLEQALRVFERAGARVVPAPLPLLRELRPLEITGALVEAYASHRDNLRRRWPDYGASARLALAMGALIGGADYLQIQRVRGLAARACVQMLDGIDLHATPTALAAALSFEDLAQGRGRYVDVVNTPYWSAVGFPAMSVPMGLLDARLPVGLQLAARPFAEATLLRAADCYQRHTDHHLGVAPLVLEEAFL